MGRKLLSWHFECDESAEKKRSRTFGDLAILSRARKHFRPSCMISIFSIDFWLTIRRKGLLALVTLVGYMKVAQRFGHDSRLTHPSRPLQLSSTSRIVAIIPLMQDCSLSNNLHAAQSSDLSVASFPWSWYGDVSLQSVQYDHVLLTGLEWVSGGVDENIYGTHCALSNGTPK